MSILSIFLFIDKFDISTTNLIVMTQHVFDLHFSASTARLVYSIDSAYRPDIDGLRAIAVAAVVIFHAFPNYLTSGFIGVDIFFVISGYLISSTIYNALETNSFSFGHFYIRRSRRIFPSLIVMLIACYIAGWHTLLATEYKKLGAHIAAGAGFVSNLLLYGESGYFDDDSDKKALLHLWSLGIEEQFYIVWPILLYILWKKKMNILTITIALTLSSFVLNVVRVKKHNIETFYWPTSRVWELLIAACLAFALKLRKDRFQNVQSRFDSFLLNLISNEASVWKDSFLWNVVSLSGTLLIALPVYFLTKNSIFPGWWAICPTFGTTLLILSGPTAWINKNLLSSRLLVAIGLISYPLYLWHWPLLVFTRIIVGHQISDNIHIAIIILSVVLAVLTYVFIDKPLRFGGFVKAKIVLICVSMTMIGLLGYYTYWRDGLSSRFPVGIESITRITFDRTLFRQNRCYLAVELDEWKFGACADNVEKPGSTAIILWGDSYAAHLYPGIVAAKSDLRITQLTSSRCPPILGLTWSDRPHCKQVNDYILKRIFKEKPNTVVLAARWEIYDQ
jgi:peptidoglycan/LPS O-acetylase OafA/YrhL